MHTDQNEEEEFEYSDRFNAEYSNRPIVNENRPIVEQNVPCIDEISPFTTEYIE